MDEMRSLVIRSQGGDLPAYGEIVRRFQDMAYGYAYSLLGDFHLAEDAAQEAFIEAYRGLPKLCEPAAFPGWFRRIVFKWCDRLTRGKRVPTVPLEWAGSVVYEGLGPQQKAERQEMTDKVLEAIRSLPEEERVVTTLYYINGYSQQEVADFLELPVTTVNNRLHASRNRLKQRTMTMVADTFKEHPLSGDFTQQTVDKVLKKARKLDQQREWVESEQMLREILTDIPDHPDLLTELNHALQRGRIWSHQQYGLLPDLVEHGKAALQSTRDKASVYRNIADTLLYIPDIPAAAEFIEGWIRNMGPGPESLSRLAWAQACMRHDEEHDVTWKQFVDAVTEQPGQAEMRALALGTGAVVDCLAASGQAPRAQKLVTASWELQCRLSRTHLRCLYWVGMHRRSGLAEEAVNLAREYHEHLARSGRDDVDAQGDGLMARAWFEEFKGVLADWLAWVRQRADAADNGGLRAVVPRMFITLERMGRLTERRILGLETAGVLRTAADDRIVQFADHWVEVTAFAPEIYIELGELGDPDGAEHAAQGAVAAGYPEEAKWLYDVAILRGEPSPADLMQLIEEKGVDEAPHGALYHVAREAAAARDEKTAFEFLQRACDECWWMRPNVRLRAWKNDARWGSLRCHPEFRRIIEEKHLRVGPATGELMYHPGW